jgi:hypothetical protein
LVYSIFTTPLKQLPLRIMRCVKATLVTVLRQADTLAMPSIRCPTLSLTSPAQRKSAQTDHSHPMDSQNVSKNTRSCRSLR